MTAQYGRFLLVEVEPDLPAARTTSDALWLSLKAVAGVRSITDMAGIDRETLSAILLEPQPVATRGQKRQAVSA